MIRGLPRRALWGISLLLLGVLLIPDVLALEEKLGLELEWTFNTSDQFPGTMFGAGHQGGITIYDIDGDGVNELLFGTRRGDSKRLWCITGNGEFKWIFPPLDQDGLPGDPTSKVSIVDVDCDMVYELALAGRGGRLHIIEPDGTLLWTWDEPTEQNMHGAPQAMDVDGDGYVEFFLNTNDGFVHRVNAVPGVGLLLNWTSSQSGAGNQGQPTICDVDRDGRFEVIYASQDFYVYCKDADTGGEKWRFNVRANMETNQVIVADVNRDGEYEVLAWTAAPTSAVICISPFGTEIWRWTHPREGVNLRLCQAIGDLDGDGIMDMAVMSGDSVFAISIGRAYPATMWELNFSYLSETDVLPEGALADHWASYQTIVDIDGDDRMEVLWLAPFPIVTDGATGRIEAYYVDQDMARYRRPEDGGSWGDVDGDGFSEWVASINGNSHARSMVYCLSLGGKFPANAYWPEYYHSALPLEAQKSAGWLLLKGACSNSLWFPIELQVSEFHVFPIIVLLGAFWFRGWKNRS
ncbi:MAG: PQQ-like beta-propeller repeat protein [Theionarchaea archaeon]|nr:PQQ-like beta-propeller repeat protein [Theionarchaea archaeon]